MTLKGLYVIRNRGTETFVQRSGNEDKSLLPKPVISVPPEVDPRPWLIEPRGPETYTLKADDAPAFSRNHLVFVSLNNDVPEEEFEWRITPIPWVGPDVYIIEKVSKIEGWVLSEKEPGTQVASRPLIVGPSDPPFYPPNQLWSIVPVFE